MEKYVSVPSNIAAIEGIKIIMAQGKRCIIVNSFSQTINFFLDKNHKMSSNNPVFSVCKDIFKLPHKLLPGFDFMFAQ